MKPNLITPIHIPPVDIHKYERYLPTAFDESMSLLDKVNKVIHYLAEYSRVTNEMLDRWNAVYEWVVGEGLNVAVRNRLDEMVEDGTLKKIINEEIFSDLNNKIDNGLKNVNDKIDVEIEHVKNVIDSLSKTLKDEIDQNKKETFDVFQPYKTSISVSQAKERFIKMMNEKASAYQMTDTNFVNPHGLHNSSQSSTAFDMLLMGMQTTGYDKLMEIMARRNFVTSIQGPNARQINVETSVDVSSLNDNHLLVGAKTGTVTANGDRVQNLIAFAQPKKTGSFFVGAVMGANPSRYTSMRHLFDIAQSSMHNKFDFKYHTNNLSNGNFDEGFTGWTPNGYPILDKVDYFMFPQAVNVGSNGTSNYLGRYISLTPGNIYYISAYVKCTRYASGYIGLQVSGVNPTLNDRLSRTTRGWSKVSLRFVAETTGATINVGGMENADLDGLVGAVNVINLTSAYGVGAEPSKDFMDSEQWRNISGGTTGAGIVSQVAPKSNAYDRNMLEILFEKNARLKYPPASLTKLMTAMLLVDNETDLSRKVEIISSDLTAGSGSTFHAGDILSLQDCLYHLLLESSNTIATAISRLVGKKVILYENLGIK